MKYLFSVFTMVFVFGIGQLNAQENTNPETTATTEVAAEKSCSKKCSKTCMAKAEKAAAMDDSIEKKVCEKSGKVSYQKKATCPVTGTVSYTQVEYDETTAQFVDIDDTAVKASSKKACCSGKKAKGCCSSKAKASTSSAEMAPAEATEGTK